MEQQEKRGIDAELSSLASSDSISLIACELCKEYDLKDTNKHIHYPTAGANTHGLP